MFTSVVLFDRSTSQQTTDQLQREVEQLQAKLVSLETTESEQVGLNSKYNVAICYSQIIT